MSTTTPFSQHLAHLNKGLTDAELTEALADIVKAVRETRKSGKVVLTLDIQLMNNTDEMLTLKPTITTKRPKLDSRKAIFWSTHDGDLLRNDPDQGELELKTVPTTNTAPRRIG